MVGVAVGRMWLSLVDVYLTTRTLAHALRLIPKDVATRKKDTVLAEYLHIIEKGRVGLKVEAAHVIMCHMFHYGIVTGAPFKDS